MNQHVSLKHRQLRYHFRFNRPHMHMTRRAYIAYMLHLFLIERGMVHLHRHRTFSQ